MTTDTALQKEALFSKLHGNLSYREKSCFAPRLINFGWCAGWGRGMHLSSR